MNNDEQVAIEMAEVDIQRDLKTLKKHFEQYVADVANYNTVDVTISSWGEKIEFEFNVYSEKEKLNNGRISSVMGKGKTYDEALADFKSKIQ